jgi:ElaB/YqjD/DUF883 family membrane-anchored ribosome-binding protein
MASEQAGRHSAKGNAESEIGREAEALQAQIEALKADIAAIGATLKDLVKSSVREGRARAEKTAEQYMQQGQEQADAALESARAYSEALEGQITKNPFTAVLVALGLGYLVGLMSRR